MKKGWWILLTGVVFVGGIAAWFLLSYQDALFRIKPIRSRLLDTLPVSGTPHFRREAIGPSGALCGWVNQVTGGQHIDTAPQASATPRVITPIDAGQWRRFIVIPGVPAFYVEGLTPWALSLDGKKIATDVQDLEQQRDELTEQYTAAAAVDRIDAARTAQEIQIKTIAENFESKWGDECPPNL